MQIKLELKQALYMLKNAFLKYNRLPELFSPFKAFVSHLPVYLTTLEISFS